jgi:hypothetical protein
MQLFATTPGVQFYTGNFLSAVSGKGGATYEKHHVSADVALVDSLRTPSSCAPCSSV